MKKKIVCVMFAMIVAFALSACNVGDALIAAGEALNEESESVSEEQESETATAAITEDATEEETKTETNTETTEISNLEEDDDNTANPPTGDVYDIGNGMTAGDYLETNYSSYQNGGVLDFGAKQGNIGVAFDEGITFFFEATQNLQSFGLEIEEEPADLMASALVVDINFDGYNDFLLPCVLGASNICYNAYIYEDWSGYFVEETRMQEVYNPEFHADKKIMTSYAHISAGEYEEAIYEWPDMYSLYRHLVRKVSFDNATQKYVVTVTYLSTDGRVGQETSNSYSEAELVKLPAIEDLL